MRTLRWATIVPVLWCGLVLTASASAQGLLWNLPEDGTSVRYAGTYKNVQERPLSNEGPLELTRLVELTISSVGKEEAEFKGETVPCRWVEFKLVMGTESAQGIQPGPYGVRIYKVLVPESAVKGEFRDTESLPVEFVPVVKGFRQVGNRPPEPIKEPILTAFPMLSLFMYYEEIKPESDESLNLGGDLGSVTAKLYKGTQHLISPVSKSTNEGQIWLAADMPFGWAKYQVKILREEKDSTAPANAFAKAAEVEIVMEAREKGANAQSELGAANEAAPAEQPAGEEPATEEPATEEPPAEEPATEKPAEEAPAEEKPAEEALTEEPSTEEPATEEPPAEEKPGT